ncbi:MAG: radical SAM protein [Deltaproteobacteria bacterium]|nr:radical SAM protein [Deltaproteobacteria bacterium]
MDVIIIAGLSNSGRSQFGILNKVVKDGRVMNYANLQRYFGIQPNPVLSDFSTPYLAGIYLYSFLSRRGIRCGLINFLDKEMEQFQKLLSQSPKAIALSSTFLTDIRSVKKVTQMIRRLAPEIKIIMGGPLVYNSYLLYQLRNGDYDTASCTHDYFFLNAEEYYYKDIDVFVIEEQGENTLYQVIEAIKKGRDYKKISNLAYYRNNHLVFTGRRAEDNSFTEDLILWDQVPDEYLSPVFPMRGSRGCPYRCRYCNFSPNRAFRLKSAEIVGQEIAALAKTGKVKLIRFTDDNLFLNFKKVEEYCRKIMEVGKGMRWSSFIRANSISRESVKLLRDSGCISTMIGMESGNKNILKEMKKEDTPERYIETVELLNQHGISTQLTFLIGFPGETLETIEDTVNLINQFQHQGPAINEVSVFPFILLPLSPIYSPENRKKYNLQGHMMNWSHDTMNSENARQQAGELFFKVKQIHCHYGVEELLMLNAIELKKVAEIRSQICRAEKAQDSPQHIEELWNDLKKLILSNNPGP